MSDFTRDLGSRAARVHFDALEPQALDLIRSSIADCVGVALAAQGEEVVRVASEAFALMDGTRNEATTLLGGHKVSSPQAALLNATAAHALDFDDTGLDGHPGIVLFPAALAEAERLGASGRDVMTAYAAGYEVWARLRLVEPDKIHTKGWHPSATLGAVAAAAAAARVAGLPPAQISQALAIAASMAAGVVANFGSMMKPLQVGLAVSNGVRAARLAAAGLSASPDALEHPAGLLHALSPSGRLAFDALPGRIDDSASAVLQFGINIKRYPVCYAMHRIVDAMAQLCADAHIDAAHIERIEAHIGSRQAAMLRDGLPEDPLSAKFNLRFGLACMASAARIGLDDLSAARLAQPQLRALMRCVNVVTSDERDPEDPLFSPADWVVVTLRDGRRLTSEPVAQAFGHARRPVTFALLQEKFDACAARAMTDRSERAAMFARFMELERFDNLADLMTGFASR